MPRSVIVVPSFNRPAALRACLRALSSQDDSDFEIVVIDDGSPEPLADICSEFGEKVRCVRQENSGPAAARNAGVSVSDAEFVAFTDDDCRPSIDWLRKLRLGWDQRPRRLVGGRVVNGLPENVYAAASQAICDHLYDYFSDRDGTMPFFTSNNLGCSRDEFERVGGFDESFPLAAAEDRELGLRWAEAGGDLHYIPEAVVEHRHALGLARFFRQHANYGRGARHLHRILADRASPLPRREPLDFYVQLVLHPLRRGGLAGLPVAALVGLSQAAMVWGYTRRRDRR